MDIKTDILTSPNELLIKARNINWMPSGGDRFSVKSLLSYPAIWIGFSLLSISSIIANPAPANLSHFLKEFILGTPPQQSALEYRFPSELTEKKLLKMSEIWNFQPSIEDQLFKNFSTAERAEAEKEIRAQIKTYKDAGDAALRAERVLDWEKTTLKPILELDVAAGDRKFWSDFLSAIVYVESGGEHSATSEVEIQGLAQISEATAAATAKQHGIASFDLRKGWDSLRLSSFHLQDLMKIFPPDISLLAYYGGQGLADRKISESPNTQLNIFNLGSEDGKEYFKKFVAALRILKEARGS